MCHILGFENSVLSEITSLQISSTSLMKFQQKPPTSVWGIYVCVHITWKTDWNLYRN